MATNSGGLDSLVVLGFFCEQKQFGDKQFQASSGGFPTARKMRCIKIYIYTHVCIHHVFVFWFSFRSVHSDWQNIRIINGTRVDVF